MGKRVRKMNFLSHSLEVVIVLSLIYCLRVCRLCTEKKNIASWGVCYFGDVVLHVYLCDLFFVLGWGSFSSDNKWLFFFLVT